MKKTTFSLCFCNNVFGYSSYLVRFIWSTKVRVSIVEFIVGNTVEFMNVTMNMIMYPTNSDKVSEKLYNEAELLHYV